MKTNNRNKSSAFSKRGASTEEESFNRLCSSFEKKYGHGWKRRMAGIAKVPESTVHSWIRAGKTPPWVLRTFELLIQNNQLRRTQRIIDEQIADLRLVDQVSEDKDGFAVHHIKDGVGNIIAREIPELEMAQKIAALPKLEKIAMGLSDTLLTLIDNGAIEKEALSKEEWMLTEELECWSAPPNLNNNMSDAKAVEINDALLADLATDI